MTYGFSLRRLAAVLAFGAALCLTLEGGAFAQGRRGAGFGAAPPPLQTGRDGAPVDLTGYWVSVVTEDWLYRMVTPPKGDFASVPLNAEGRRVGNAWNPDQDIASGQQCKSYGAAGLMRVPGRLHITWQDDQTLKVETDSGMQTRLFHFPKQSEDAQGELLSAVEAPAGIDDSLQGYSVARWERAGGGRGPGGGFPGVAGRAPKGGSMEVVTTHLLPGYLRKNGVPYSGHTLLTEYYDRTDEDNGDTWLIITTIVHDPQYLTREFVTSTH
ncbi:MAG TPA: hypothetical protein VFY39_07325, partial [Gammaproteobacteria bacterium]|nr:hypothetical protein [Gammaproteobacteria bacterium]